MRIRTRCCATALDFRIGNQNVAHHRIRVMASPFRRIQSARRRRAFEVRILAVSADRRSRSDILIPLNNRKFQLAAALLRGVTLKSVLVRSANPGHFHANQHTSSRFRQRVFAYLVLPGFYQRCCKHAWGRHKCVRFALLSSAVDRRVSREKNRGEPSSFRIPAGCDASARCALSLILPSSNL